MPKRRYEAHRLDLNVIMHYLIPVMRLMRDGTTTTDAFAQVAKSRSVSAYTVYENCTRRLGMTTPEFVITAHSGRMKEHLLATFPNDADLLVGVDIG